MMRPARVSRLVHKWFALAVGVQLFIWAASGFYMVSVPIDIIHGDMLIRNFEEPLGPQVRAVLPPAELIERHPQVDELILTSLQGRPVYLVSSGANSQLLDAITGEPWPVLTQQAVTAIAQYYYAGPGQVEGVEQLSGVLPREAQFLRAPVWRVDFDDIWGSTLYIDATSGRVAVRRHTLWRVFDFLWMLHIMDYDQRENVNNLAVRGVTLLALVLGLSGVWLLYFRLRRAKPKRVSS